MTLSELISGLVGRKKEDSPDEVMRIINILNQNKDKNFIQRIMRPDLYPLLDEYAGPGTHGTHLMSSAQVGDKNIVYPNIVQPRGAWNLKMFDPKSREAIDYALKNNEYAEFETPEEAEWFGKNYKRVWGRR